MVALDEFLTSLDLTTVGEGRLMAPSLPSTTNVVFGGQILAQGIVAASRSEPTKAVMSVHAVFARAADPSRPIEIDVEPFHRGRTVTTLSVRFRQGERQCSLLTIVCSASEADVIRHAPAMPDAGTPDDATPASIAMAPGEVRVVGDADLGSPSAGPAEYLLWYRCPGVPDRLDLHQALVADLSDGYLIGTALLRHEGVSQRDAHVTIDTGVVDHTIAFHEPFRLDDWVLVAHESPYAGRGRAHGRAQVFAKDGRLLASFAQNGIIRRPVPGGDAARSAH